MNKRKKDRLIAVRMTEEDLMILKERAKRTGIPVSTQIRDLIRSGLDPSELREQTALLKKIRTDLSYCRHRILRECTDETVQRILPVFAGCSRALETLENGGGIYGDHKAGSS